MRSRSAAADSRNWANQQRMQSRVACSSQVVGSRLTVAVLASGPIRSKRLTREGDPQSSSRLRVRSRTAAAQADGPGVLPTRQPWPTQQACDRLLPVPARRAGRRGSAVVACEQEAVEKEPVQLAWQGSLSRKQIVGDGARASIARAHGCAGSSRPLGAVRVR